MRVLMVAAENDALPGAKVGGVADVVRDLPRALAAQGDGKSHAVSVVVPSYGVLHELAGASPVAEFDAAFRGDSLRVSLWQIGIPAVESGAGGTENSAANGDAGCGENSGGGACVRQFVLHSAAFAPGIRGQVYCDDPPQRPFATDANKFALFSAAVCKGVAGGAFGTIDVIHLHDWHTALVLLLRACDPAYAALKKIRCVFTIHNLALQGVRPLRGDSSSLLHWFPGLQCTRAQVIDPRWDDCVNPMAVGIRLADAVNTVSPSYAQDILTPNAIDAAGFHGGEGLEQDLRVAHEAGRLYGVLNGCEYPDPDLQGNAPDRRSWPRLMDLLRTELLALAAEDAVLASVHFIALQRLEALARKRPGVLVTGIGRIVNQKLGLLQESVAGNRTAKSTALEAMLAELGERGLFVLLGSGDPLLETWLREVAARHPNFLLIRGYAPRLGQGLYRNGDLFLMPSSFEPCGISQMLAMRAGQPCLVHAVGGLRDTVRHEVNGFSFNGANRGAQAKALVHTFAAVLKLREDEPARFKRIATAAAAARFSWADSAQAYLRDVYAGAVPGAESDPTPDTQRHP